MQPGQREGSQDERTLYHVYHTQRLVGYHDQRRGVGYAAVAVEAENVVDEVALGPGHSEVDLSGSTAYDEEHGQEDLWQSRWKWHYGTVKRPGGYQEKVGKNLDP